jgi:hypothetical protein
MYIDRILHTLDKALMRIVRKAFAMCGTQHACVTLLLIRILFALVRIADPSSSGHMLRSNICISRYPQYLRRRKKHSSQTR